MLERQMTRRCTFRRRLHFSADIGGSDAHSPFTLRRVHLPSPDPTWPPSVLFPRARTSAAAAFAAPAPSAPARCPPSPAPSTSPVLTWLTDPPMTSTSGAARSPSPSPRARPRCVKRLIRSDAPIANRFCPRIARLRGRVTRDRRCDHAKENPYLDNRRRTGGNLPRFRSMFPSFLRKHAADRLSLRPRPSR